MFGVRLTSLFTSRWMALAWAVLICLSAIEFVGGRGTGDGNDQAAQDAETAQAVNTAMAAMK
jgi:Na+/glutamate symporter